MRRAVTTAWVLVVLAALAPGAAAAAPHHAGPQVVAAHPARVLRVGTWHGIRGQFRSIQSAVDAARPGDWILVGPGDYKTRKAHAPAEAKDRPAGVLITTPDVTLRGMNRDHVIVDGTRSGPACSTAKKDQNLGPKAQKKHLGLNGIEVWKANNVTVQNVTACNFLHAGDGDTGNEIWWNGGDGSGLIGGWGYHGAWLTATNTYYHGEQTASQYGIFSSNWNGGTWNHTYASNFNDSGLYIGACHRECNQKVNHTWSEWNALGYSGSNSGGRLVIENSEFDHNEDGFDTNSQNGDNPPPQNGDCPGKAISPITHTHSCWVFIHNYVHDNNDPNVPTAGSAAAGPVGTGISISGGRNDTVMDNLFEHNKAWGVIFVPYPDSGDPCRGGTQSGSSCIFDEYGDALVHNRFAHNGGYGNPSNGDFAATNLETGPTDCYHGNKEVGGGPATSSPSNAQQMYPKCNGKQVPADLNGTFTAQALCDSGASLTGSGSTPCPAGANYPRQTEVLMHPLPGVHGHGAAALEHPTTTKLATMPHPCAGVPANPWCPASGHSTSAAALHATPRRQLHTFGRRPDVVLARFRLAA
jgi:hypothetical protein